MSTQPMALTAVAVVPANPYIALIATPERLPLRDVTGQTLVFNLNIATAVVSDSDDAAKQFLNIATNQSYLRMWDQVMQLVTGSLVFDLFTITGNTVTHSGSYGSATPLDASSAATCAPCKSFLDHQISCLIQMNQSGLFRWKPDAPSGAVSTEAPASVYQSVAWRHTVAHASTWPRPIPQGLNLSFEVGVPQAALNGVDSVLLYPRFASDAVDPTVANLYQPLPGDPWNSYGAKYTNSPRWAFQAPCPVAPKQSSGLVNPATYWVMKDPTATDDRTSDWRQNVEALIENRFDYLPRLLGIVPRLLENLADDAARQRVGNDIWALGLEMLRDLSTIGADPLLEGTTVLKIGPTIQYTLLLRALEAIYSFPSTGNDKKTLGLVQLLAQAETGSNAWTKRIELLLQGLDQRLAQTFSSPPGSTAYQSVVPTLQRLTSILSNDENLSTLLLSWWDSVFPSPAGQPRPNDWSDVLTTLENNVFPSAQLHNRFLSTLAAKSLPLAGSSSPTPVAALGLPFPGRSEHTSVWYPAANDSSLDGQLIVFGGCSGGATALATLQGTWSLNAAKDGSCTWTEVIAGGNPPVARRAHSAVVDFPTSQMLVYGGFSSDGSALNDLSNLKLATYGAWSALAAAGGPSIGRGGHSAVYDQANSRMIVFGGGIGNPPVTTAEVWVLSNANSQAGVPAWTQLTSTGGPPTPRMFHSAAYDPGSNRMIVFAGASADGGTRYNDVWVLTNANGTGGAPVWIALASAGNPPSIRSNHTAIYDVTNNRMILYGGKGSNGALGDVWVLSNANGLNGNPAWSEVTPAGDTVQPRWGHTSVYNSASNGMLVFSGADEFIPDLYTLSNANGLSGTPTWTQLSPPGLPQVDAAVRAAVAGWVIQSAIAANVDASFINALTTLVVADVNNPLTGLTTVAPQQPQKTKRPHPVVLQVGGWSASSDSGPDDVNEDLRRYAGVGALIRTRNLQSGTKTPWRCINAADITISYDGQSTQILASFVASRLQYRNGMKDPFVSYDNHPLIATSPATALQGRFAGAMATAWAANTVFGLGALIKDPNAHKQMCTQAGTSGVVSPSWNDQGGVTQDGPTLQWTDQGPWPAPVPNLLAYAPAKGTYGTFYGLIFGVTFEFAPFAISHGGAMPKEIEPSAGVLNDPIQFDDTEVIRQVTYLRRVPVGHLRVMSASATAWSPNSSVSWPVIPPTVYPLTRDLIPSQGPRKDLPLLLLPFSSSAVPGFETFSFQILPPAIDINTWDRWVADGSVYGVGTTNTRTAVWAAFHRESNNVTGPANAETNQIGDPAVSALMLSLEWLDLSKPTPTWVPMPNQTQWVDVTYKPVTPSAYDSPSAWVAVNPVPTPIKVENGNQFQLSSDGKGGFNVSLPEFSIARLTISSLVADGDYTKRFEQEIFAPNSVTRPASGSAPAKNYQVLGSNFCVVLECPTNASTSLKSLLDNLSVNLVSPRNVAVTLTNLSNFRSVGVFEIKRQDWRWLGRPLPDLASFANPLDWETRAFVDRLNNPDFVSSFKRFSPVSNQANPPVFLQTLSSIDLSKDGRCQYIRFSIEGHNRYEDMPFFEAAAVNDNEPTSQWKSICVPRDPDPPIPPKPAIRLVLPLMQRTRSVDGTPQADLLVIADESWYRIGGLGETLTAQVQPVLGTENTTILGPPYQYTVRGRFNGDAGVVYLDSGVAFQLTDSPTAAGQYSVKGKVYTFSVADAGENVAISYLEPDPTGKQLYEFGPDQLVTGAPAATANPPQITLEPMGATLEDASVSAPNFTNTYFSASVGQADLVSWNQFKVQFRRELQSFGDNDQDPVVSAWTDPVWVETLPDSATFKNATGTRIICSEIAWKWSPLAGQLSTISLFDGSGKPLTILPTAPSFQLWYVVTETITDAFGDEADIYLPPTGGTPSAPQFQPVDGQDYKLRIVEVQASPVAWGPTVFDDSNFLNVPRWQHDQNYLVGQIVIDSAMKHIRQVIAAGRSGAGPGEPPWTADGTSTHETGGLTWADKGLWNGDESLRIVRISPSISIEGS
jgi:Galactose oxidase, central domain